MNTISRHNNLYSLSIMASERPCAAELCSKLIDNSHKAERFGWPFKGKEVTGEEAVHRR